MLRPLFPELVISSLGTSIFLITSSGLASSYLLLCITLPIFEKYFICRRINDEGTATEAKQKYRGMFETRKSGKKASSGEIVLNIRTPCKWSRHGCCVFLIFFFSNILSWDFWYHFSIRILIKGNRGVKSRMCPPYPQRVVKGELG